MQGRTVVPVTTPNAPNAPWYARAPQAMSEWGNLGGDLRILFEITMPHTLLHLDVATLSSGGLEMTVNNGVYHCTTRRMNGQLWMQHDVPSGTPKEVNEVTAAASLVSAAYDESSGSDQWMILDGCGVVTTRSVPFTVLRKMIQVKDRATTPPTALVTYDARGRDGVHRTKSDLFGGSTERQVYESHPASCSQLPHLREVVATALLGMVTLMKSRVQFATAGNPSDILLTELAVPITVSMPVISLFALPL
jgi:hypothetical protein